MIAYLAGLGFMSVDSVVPDRFWPAVRWVCINVLSWVLPLIATERFADEHYLTATVLSGLSIANWVIIAKWDGIADLVTSWRRGLASVCIAIGAIFLCVGIYLLAAQPLAFAPPSSPPTQANNGSAAPSAPVFDAGQLKAAQDENAELERQLSTAKEELRSLQAQESKPWAATPATSPNIIINPISQGLIVWSPTTLGSIIQVERANKEQEPTVTLYKMYNARNASGEPIVNVRAFVTPELTGEDLLMLFYDPHNDVSKKTSILPGEEFNLYYDLRPQTKDLRGVSMQEYLDKFGGITVRLESTGSTIFKQSFPYSEIKRMLSAIQDEELAKKRLR